MTFDLTGWTIVRATGADAPAFLQRFCTNDLLGPETTARGGCEMFFCTEKARVVAHGWLLKDVPEPGAVTFVGTPGQGPRLVAHLSKYALMEDVEFADRTGGPLSYTPRADGLPSGDLHEQGRFAFAVPPEAVPLSEAARIAAKLPAVGVDLTERHLCMEADRPWAICYTKGCYLGQEPVARVRALGRVNKLLRGFRFAAKSSTTSAGATVAAGGADAGAVTSAAGRVALGLAKRAFAEPGTAVEIGGAAATVF